MGNTIQYSSESLWFHQNEPLKKIVRLNALTIAEIDLFSLPFICVQIIVERVFKIFD